MPRKPKLWITQQLRSACEHGFVITINVSGQWNSYIIELHILAVKTTLAVVSIVPFMAFRPEVSRLQCFLRG